MLGAGEGDEGAKGSEAGAADGGEVADRGSDSESDEEDDDDSVSDVSLSDISLDDEAIEAEVERLVREQAGLPDEAAEGTGDGAAEVVSDTGIDALDQAMTAVRQEDAEVTEDAVRFRELQLNRLQHWVREQARLAQLLMYRAYSADAQLKIVKPFAEHKRAMNLASTRDALKSMRRLNASDLKRDLPPAILSPKESALQLSERARVAYGGILHLLKDNPLYVVALLRSQHPIYRVGQASNLVGSAGGQMAELGSRVAVLSRFELSRLTKLVTSLLFPTRDTRSHVSGKAAENSLILPDGRLKAEAEAGVGASVHRRCLWGWRRRSRALR